MAKMVLPIDKRGVKYPILWIMIPLVIAVSAAYEVSAMTLPRSRT